MYYIRTASLIIIAENNQNGVLVQWGGGTIKVAIKGHDKGDKLE